MKKFIKNWNARRIFYLIGGLFFVAIAFVDRVWWIALFGLYYISMSVFRFGCAAGNCDVPFSEKNTESNP